MKFKVGDKVRILTTSTHSDWEGKETTIYDIGRFNHNSYNETDVWIINPLTGEKYGLWFYSSCFELVPSKEFEGDIEFTVEV